MGLWINGFMIGLRTGLPGNVGVVWPAAWGLAAAAAAIAEKSEKYVGFLL